MPKIGEVEANDVRSAVLRHVASLKRARLTQGAFSRHFSSKKELLCEAIDDRFTQGPFKPADQADQPLGNLIRRYLTKVHRQRGHVMSRTNFGDGNCAPPFLDEAGFHFTSAEELCSDRFQAFQQEARSGPPQGTRWLSGRSEKSRLVRENIRFPRSIRRQPVDGAVALHHLIGLFARHLRA